MSHRAHRPVVIFLTVLSLSLPLAAQPHREAAESTPRISLAALWSRLTAPFAALWGADSAAGPVEPESPQPPPPLPETTPPPVLDGRSVIDPLG